MKQRIVWNEKSRIEKTASLSNIIISILLNILALIHLAGKWENGKYIIIPLWVVILILNAFIIYKHNKRVAYINIGSALIVLFIAYIIFVI